MALQEALVPEALPPPIQALLSPAAYAHAADDRRLHETHCSWVVLAGRYAYKVKKPVDLGFLDFTTAARRAVPLDHPDHASAPTGPGIDVWGEPASVRAVWAENFAQTAGVDRRVLPVDARGAVRRYVSRFLEEQAPLMARRVAAGRIREGHGDLHAGNVCLVGRRLLPFDCLEFAARFRCADVAADVAFLAMDLDHYGRADLAAAFVDAYVRAAGDADLPRLLDFYKCYRAYVRGKVLGMRLGQASLAPAAAGEVAAAAAAYFELARAYAERPANRHPPLLAAVLGPPASGKTTVARGLAGRLGLVHLSSDVVRKELAGLGPHASCPVSFGAGPYGAEMTRRTYATLLERAGRWLRRGQAVVLDATFGRPAQRAALGRLARRCRAPLVVFWCRAGEDQLRARLAARASGPPGESDARPELWPALRAAFATPAELPDVIGLNTGGSPDEAVRLALAEIRERTFGAALVGPRPPLTRR